MNRSIRQKRKSNFTEDSSDFISNDFDHSKLSKHTMNLQSIDRDYDDSNDSFNMRDTSFTDKDFNLSIAERKQIRQRNMHSSRSNEFSRLQQCLDYIHRILSRKDKEDFFQFPVTDVIAPGYSSLIQKPMDFSTMKKKIDSGVYANILEYRDDFVLMCENAMTYNKSDTIYYHAARKLLDSGLKVLNKDKLVSLRRSLGIMKNLPHSELGFVPDGEVETPPPPPVAEVHVQRKKHVVKTTFKHEYYYPSEDQLIARSGILRKLDLYREPHTETPEEILTETQALSKSAVNKLNSKFPNSKLGFLRRNSNGTTSLKFLNQDDNTVDKQLTVGMFCDVLNSGSYSLNSFIEEKKNKTKPMHYLEYGPFSSHAPTYDSSFSNITKDESDLLMSTYGDEQAYQYALSLMEFSKGTGPLFNDYVNRVLNKLTNNEHDKYLEKTRLEATQANSSQAVAVETQVGQSMVVVEAAPVTTAATVTTTINADSTPSSTVEVNPALSCAERAATVTENKMETQSAEDVNKVEESNGNSLEISKTTVEAGAVANEASEGDELKNEQPVVNGVHEEGQKKEEKPVLAQDEPVYVQDTTQQVTCQIPQETPLEAASAVQPPIANEEKEEEPIQQTATEDKMDN